MPDWYGFSIADYASPSGWETALTRADPWKFNVHRLHFYFKNGDGTLIPAETLYAQLDGCLGAIANHRARAVLDLHNYGAPTDTRNVLVGSQEWFENWLLLVQRFKNDRRVVAWELCNESFYQFLDPAYGGDGTNFSSLEKAEGLMKAQYDLSVQIRAIDPNRPIIWFPNYHVNLVGDFTPLDSPVTHTNYTQLIRNIILTEHPYTYLMSDGTPADTWEELQALWDYRLIKINGDAQAYPIWIGEIECHGPANGGAITVALEEQYVANVLANAVVNHWGFAIWKYPTMDYAGSDADRVIAQSGYIPSPPFPWIPIALTMTGVVAGAGIAYWLL